ncbi:hypothetical protein C922_03550 [Plasmodium inui San Antonio 1]|uniref:Gfo/Idh/MocA-like oxidoreductase N-terminal domain-containing protein n=1 Tax=Plasmodium inui San Antonio 1 TaxID=1237626 RepID=W7A356_9APIC|nr:hypothetical protein C922_03550 [Plasmodium inui San Antonio 1]EUD66080.1 hypothetical protein C922_03550 [Plasmodium inui San Antonio 1]
MSRKKPQLFLICDSEGFTWIPLLTVEWKIKYLFCSDAKMKRCFVDTFGLYDTETNTHDNVLKFIEKQNLENVHLLFIAMSTSKLHELILEYIINQKKFYYIFSSNLPTMHMEKLSKLKASLKNFNIDSDIIYDVKAEFKKTNKQFYWNIFNALTNQRVFYNLKTTLHELGGHIYGVQIECTFMPFLTDNEGIENVLFYKTVLIISLIEFLFCKPKSVSAKCYSVKGENITVKSIAGSALFDSLNCHFNISDNSSNRIFDVKVFGDNGSVEVSYNAEHNCFQLLRCMNHYEYPSLFVESAHESALNELKYFVDENLYTNKYLNMYTNAIHTALCLWKSNGENISLDSKKPDECAAIDAEIRVEAVKNFSITA